jgi:hypothetical protein
LPRPPFRRTPDSVRHSVGPSPGDRGPGGRNKTAPATHARRRRAQRSNTRRSAHALGGTLPPAPRALFGLRPQAFRDRPTSKYPPAKPEALRWLAPQRGLTATVGKRPLTRPRPSATLSPGERECLSARGSAPGTTPALSQGRGWRPCAAG